MVRARREGGSLAKAHAQHMAVTALAGGLFLAEEVWPQVPFIHGVWHLAAAWSIAGFAAAMPKN